MKRDCLLSRTYTGGPMTFNGVDIHYSALVNEIVREFKTAFFCGDGPGDQTHFLGMAEGLMIMKLMAEGDFKTIGELRQMARPERHGIVLTFALMHEAEIERLKPELIARLEATLAATVESAEPGKCPPPAPASSP
jgi:hypothetical protein